MKIFLPLFLIVLAALVGCKKQPEMGSNLLVITAIKGDFDTKATEAAFEVGDTIGLYVNENVGNLPYETLDGTSWKCRGFLNEFLAGKDYYATAYYPFSESTKDATAIEVGGADFMISAKTKLDISGNEAAGTLQFKHVLSKLVVSIDTPEEIDGIKTVSLDSIIIKNVFRKGVINLATGVISNLSDKGDIASATNEIIVIPQTVSRIEFVFKMAGGGFSKLAYVKGVVLESGKKTTLNAHSNADLYFASILDLKSGEAQTNLPLSIFVAKGRAWTLTSSAPWLTFSKTSGIGKGLETITVNVAQNAGTPRTATLTLADDKPSKTTTKTMQNYIQTVTIAGTKWTTRNLTGTTQGQTSNFTLAANPQDYGMFWKWGSLFMYDRVSGNIPAGHWGGHTTGSGSYPAGDPCRTINQCVTPTAYQWQALVASGSSVRTTYKNVGGYFFGPKATSCNNITIQDGCIFIPTADYRSFDSGVLGYESNTGSYWSSTKSTLGGYNIRLLSNSIVPVFDNYSGHGFSVRCVAE